MVFGIFTKVAEGHRLFQLLWKFVTEFMFQGVDLVLELLFDGIGHELSNYKPKPGGSPKPHVRISLWETRTSVKWVGIGSIVFGPGPGTGLNCLLAPIPLDFEVVPVSLRLRGCLS